ncbi:uncharacterized protein EV422DRAFT_507639 [Fimicolochytrium jonesii]|uniref:uncharacterized protein n=1 Tax=Fimicolochytrium jonesii TaxID=1396493 RepID=UPI0022FDDCD4|nr:uncharacterized protein EV422DRAFT_507639 [Fimicolochytrium jonesii]KAI8819187.1 hypothetical protein EV422DRAFT_507639 [Fimicolochytrium jonesii]
MPLLRKPQSRASISPAFHKSAKVGLPLSHRAAQHHSQVVERFFFSDITTATSDSLTTITGQVHLHLRTFLVADIIQITLSEDDTLLAKTTVWTPPEWPKRHLIDPDRCRCMSFELTLHGVTREMLAMRGGPVITTLRAVIERSEHTSGKVVVEQELLLQEEEPLPPYSLLACDTLETCETCTCADSDSRYAL